MIAVFKRSLGRLLLRGAEASFSQTLLGLASRNDEVIVFTVAPPRARRHIAHFDKLPIGYVGWRECEIIAHGRRNIQTSSMVQIWFWPFILEHVLEMIGAEWAAIFPLRIASTIPFSDGDPVIFAHGLTRSGVKLFEPRNHERSFRFKLTMCDIVVRLGAVEGVLVRDKPHRNIVPPGR